MSNIVKEELIKILKAYNIHPYSIEAEHLQELGYDIQSAMIKEIQDEWDLTIGTPETILKSFEKYLKELIGAKRNG